MKKVKFMFLIIALVMSVSGCSEESGPDQKKEQKVNEAQVNTVNTNGFVQVNKGKFMIDGQEFRFMGTNNYYLNYKDEEMIDDVIVSAKEMGVKVIRMWGFLDGMGDTMANNNAYMQTEPGVFDQIPDNARNGFEAMDYAIKRAGEEGIYLVIVLTNNWDAFGGVNQYVEWSETAESHDDFFTDDECKLMYKDYVNYVIGRTNSITGIPYREDKAIMTWELINEPRVESDPSGNTLYNWAVEMSAYIKSLDPNHLVALGDEGFYNKSNHENWAYNGFSGVDFERNLAIEHIDYGTFHLYPEHWGDGFDNPIKSGNQWITDHVQTGDQLDKPVVLEEYGIQRGITHNRNYIYSHWLRTVYENGLGGSQFWILTGKDTGNSADPYGLYPDYDGFRIINVPGPTFDILMEHSNMMTTGQDTMENRTFILHPRDGEKVSGIYAFKVDSLIYNDKHIKSYTLTIENMGAFDMSTSGALVMDTGAEAINGTKTINIEARLDDGSVLRDQVIVNFDNQAKIEVQRDKFTFDSDMENFSPEGTYMADFLEPKIQHTSWGGGALALNVSLSGDKEWQEVRCVNRQVSNLADVIRIEYNIYYDSTLLSGEGEWKPYAVANPGWVKLGLEANNKGVADLEVIEVDGRTYLKHHVVIPVSGIFDAPELFIGLVGSFVEYQGPVYIDDIILIGEDLQ